VKRVLSAAAALAALLTLFVYSRRAGSPEAPAARVTRATLVQVLTTNGKVEALRSVAIPIRASVAVREVLVREGDTVRAGQTLAVVDDRAAREALERARAQLEIARADRAVIKRGGAAAALAELDSGIAKARLDQQAAEREVAALKRLLERQAATRQELENAETTLSARRAEREGLEKRRRALVAPEDRQRIEARIREAETAVAQAETALRQLAIQSPAAGVLYALLLKPGVFYNAGDVAGQVGLLDQVRVRVLVDEPELGRVAPGQPVEIGWDALPERRWKGVVERLPSEIKTIGTRNVGEVLCTVENPDRKLLPNVTVNAALQTARAENTLAAPREAVAREARQSYVLTIDNGGLVVRRPVKLGIQDPTRVEVLEGLADGQLVLLPGERMVQAGERVQPKVNP
jgi:multidrug efflux pump subunit AcrA (membrane-fusion protein)